MSDEKSHYRLKALVNTYKLLEGRKPPSKKQKYTIYAYFLYSEVSPEGIHGKQIFLGSYKNKKDALDEARNIVLETGHDCIYVCKTCSWEDINERRDFDRTVYVDSKKKEEDLEEQYRQKVLKDSEKEAERARISKELDEQMKNELDPTTVEHYAHNWFNAIRNYTQLQEHKEKMEYYETQYQKRIDKIREQYKKQPDVDDTWLDIYEERLKARKEEDIFLMMKMGHERLKDEILNVK